MIFQPRATRIKKNYLFWYSQTNINLDIDIKEFHFISHPKYIVLIHIFSPHYDLIFSLDGDGDDGPDNDGGDGGDNDGPDGGDNGDNGDNDDGDGGDNGDSRR